MAITEKIVRGTTPTQTFITDLDLSNAEVIYVSYKQKGSLRVLVERDRDGFEATPNKIQFRLTQEETLKFNKMREIDIEIQIRARFPDGTAVASNWMYANVGMIVKDGVI